jgi:hypothetical protein
MTLSKQVTLEDGTVKTVYAENEADLKAGVKSVKADHAPVYPNINHPVQKGHDLVALSSELDKVLVDGTGAHNSPNDAVKPFSTETDADVKVEGLEEPAYKSVPTSGANDGPAFIEAKDADVKEAQADAKPADEVK